MTAGTPFHRALRDVRAAAAVAPARPAYAAGFRAAVATVVPLVAAEFLGTGGGTWMSLAGFNGAIADRGGPYRTRAATMGVLAVAAALAAALGTAAGSHLALAVPLTLLVATACSLARVWGNAGAGVGNGALTTFVIALAFPATRIADEAWSRAGYVLAGGAWAILVALVLWPLRPYRPLRLAVAGCYRALAAYVEGSGSSAAVRAALEQGRTALATTRRARPGESGRGEHLLVLYEIADQLFGRLLALTDTLDTIPPDVRSEVVEATVRETLAAVAGTARAMADGVEAERGVPQVAVGWDGSGLRARLDEPGATTGSGSDAAFAAAHYAEVAALLDRLAQLADVGAATVATLNSGGRPGAELGAGPTDEAAVAPFAPLRAAVSGDSVVLRYALRVGLVTAAAVWLTAALGLRRGYWVTITAVVILQPYTGATTLRALQRVAGTVIGGILTAALGAVFHDPLAILPLSFVFAGTCVALLPLNYAAFSAFLTPTFVLLAEASTGDWHLAGVRIVNTVLGGALALLGARLLWPTPEWNRLPGYMAAALRANRDYLRAAAELFDDRSPEAGRTLRAARRRVGLAALNAEESFQRALGEHRGPAEDLAPLMAFLTYTRRLAASVAALAVARHTSARDAAAALAPFARAAERVLEDLAGAAEEGRAPAPLPPLEGADGSASWPLPLRARVERVARQVRTLHDAVTRWQACGVSRPPAVGPLRAA